MSTEEKLLKIAKCYQAIIEESVDDLSGICYHSAASLHHYFSIISVQSEIIVGNLALLNNSDKYAVYGDKMNLLKQVIIGNYHAWCEVILDDRRYIVDPSIKYNKRFDKKVFKFKTSKMIPDIIISQERETYHRKYVKNDSLISQYEYYISTIPKGYMEINNMSSEIIKRNVGFTL